MPMTTTPPLPATVTYKGSKKITFHMSNPCAPLFLGTLIVTPVEPVGGALGSVAPGNATAAVPALQTLTLGAARFQAVLQYVTNNPGPFELLITYDDNYVVWGFNIVGLVMPQFSSRSTETSVETVTVDPSTGLITDVIERTVVTEA